MDSVTVFENNVNDSVKDVYGNIGQDLMGRFESRGYRSLTELPDQDKTLSPFRLFSKLDAARLWEELKPQAIKLPDLKLCQGGYGHA